MDILQVNLLLSLRSFKLGAIQTRTPTTSPRLLCASWCFIFWPSLGWLHNALHSICAFPLTLEIFVPTAYRYLPPYFNWAPLLHNWIITLLWCHSVWLTIHAMAISHCCRSHYGNITLLPFTLSLDRRNYSCIDLLLDPFNTLLMLLQPFAAAYFHDWANPLKIICFTVDSLWCSLVISYAATSGRLLTCCHFRQTFHMLPLPADFTSSCAFPGPLPAVSYHALPLHVHARISTPVGLTTWILPMFKTKPSSSAFLISLLGCEH